MHVLFFCENEKKADVAIVDILKAFNTVSHKRLLNKHSHYGNGGQMHQCMMFLYNWAVFDGTVQKYTIFYGPPYFTLLYLVNNSEWANKRDMRLDIKKCYVQSNVSQFFDPINSILIPKKRPQCNVDTWFTSPWQYHEWNMVPSFCTYIIAIRIHVSKKY